MRTKAIRVLVLAVCGAGIAGMIVASATNHNGAAITFGLITAVAVLCQMVSTTVANELQGVPGADITGSPSRPSPARARGNGDPSGADVNPAGDDAGAEDQAAALEEQIGRMVQSGIEEDAVRDLVRRAVRLGRSTRLPPGPPDS